MTKEEIVLQLTLNAMDKHSSMYVLGNERGAEASKAVGANVAALFNAIWENLTDEITGPSPVV